MSDIYEECLRGTGRAVVSLHFGKDYTVEDRGYETDSHALFQWTVGNYGCDCNRSLFIREQCDPDFPKMGCGDEITMTNLEFLDP